MRKVFEIGGVVAAFIMIAFGAVSIMMSVNGRATVRDSLKLEKVVGSPDMTPAAIRTEAKAAGLSPSIKLPTADIAGKEINTGQLARDFASYMRIHTLEASGGLTYAELPRYATADGKGTTDVTKAAKSATGQPLDNPVRNLWVTETALTTALNASFLAENVALFGIVVGFAFLLIGIGFLVLVIAGSLRGRESALRIFGKRKSEAAGTKPVPAA